MARKNKKQPIRRNFVVVAARSRYAGPMRDRRTRRAKDRLAREIRESC